MKKYNVLLPITSFSILLIAGRVVFTGTFMFSFLLWNLFLAILPLYFSYKASFAEKRNLKLLFTAAWLLFFPNAMYIITDLFHLKHRPGVPLWYDLVLLFSTALNGLIYGFISLRNMDKLWSGSFSNKTKHIAIFLVMVLCGYGIYLGRFDRWNSWDIITQPHHLLKCIAYDVRHPLRSINVWALSGCFGLWLYLLYAYIQKTRGI